MNEEYVPTEADLWALWEVVHDYKQGWPSSTDVEELLDHLRTIRAEDQDNYV